MDTSKAWRRRVAAAITALAISAAVLGTVEPAQAAACPTASGVSVVVDFNTLPGGIVRKCVAGDPTTGLAALKTAGFTYTFVPRQPGFLCQINAKPNPCNGAPPTAYWSYWHAKLGGSWQYSTACACTYNPKPGMVEGWAFGAGKPPRTRPPATTTTTR
jgi:hypothetical protein